MSWKHLHHKPLRTWCLDLNWMLMLQTFKIKMWFPNFLMLTWWQHFYQYLEMMILSKISMEFMSSDLMNLFDINFSASWEWYFSTLDLSFFVFVVVYFSSEEIYIVLSVLCLSGVTSLIFTPNSIHTEYWII